MEKTLNLKEVVVYAVESSDDEFKSSIKGYYVDRNIADIKAIKSGWYNADGKVITKHLYQDSEGKLYDVQSLGLADDTSEKLIKELTVKIKCKLNDSEWEFIKKHGFHDIFE